MLDHSARNPHGVLRTLVLGLLGTTAACLLGGPPAAPAPVATAFRDTLGELVEVRATVQPAAGEAFAVPAGAGLVVVAPQRARPAMLDDGQAKALARFVHEGGRLVLFGDAAQWVAAMGIEPELPEADWFRWGFDSRTDLGAARVGVQVVSGRLPELFDGVAQAAADGPLAFAGGAPCRLRWCRWAVGAPRTGHVLGTAAVEFDGVPAEPGAPILVHWQHGRGEVLACGVVPELENRDPQLQAAAKAFVQNCARWTRARTVCLWAEAAPAAEPELALLPMAPLLPHWGSQVPSLQRALHGADDVVAEGLVADFEAGADLCALDLVAPDGRASLPWPAKDPLRPVPSYRGGGADGFARDAVARVANEAHARSMLTFGSWDPLPVDASATEQLVAVRFFARELANLRGAGAAALDGFLLRQWWGDPKGYAAAMLQDFAPAGAMLLAGEPAGAFAGGLRAMHADDGALRSLPWSGFAGAWRQGFPADEFAFGVLEARSGIDRRQPARSRGGAAPDWIVAQANDFVRARAGHGGGMWWLHHDAALDPVAVDYVRGVSLEPLRAAVAMPLASTGSDGVRAAAAALCETPPPGFAASEAPPAAVHALQNNWFQLAGSGGVLRVDPAGRARFQGGDAQVLSPAFLRSRLFGGRPDGNAVRSDQTDFLANGRRSEGDYGPVLRLSPAGERSVPRVLAADEAPTWPRTVGIEWNASTGYHELTLVLRSVRQSGVLTVSLDGTLLRALPFTPTSPAVPITVPVHVANGGTRVLQLQVEHGGACAIDRLDIARRGDIGVEARVGVAAGCRATLTERGQSTYHAERVELVAQADLPGFVLRLQNDRTVRNLQVERVFQLPGYELVDSTDGEAAAALRRPFLLRHALPSMPDLVVAPLQLARYEQLQCGSGQLTMRSAPEPGVCSRIGFLMCEHGEGGAWLPHAVALLMAVDQPLAIDLAGVGEATLVGELPLPVSRVVEVSGRAGAPFAVCEQGWWQWRGSQAAPNGARWLRVHQQPGDAVRIVGGPSVLARTRPGPGSMRLLALREPTPTSAVVRVLQPSRLAPPSVVFATDFDAVLVDGVPWDWFDGRTVFLPDRVATARIQVQQHGGAVRPHVRSTRAPLIACQYVPERRELVLSTAGDPERPAELPWTAVLAGPVPTAIDNGEIVPDATLRFGGPDEAARAAAGGTLIRFRSGLTKVRYGE